MRVALPDVNVLIALAWPNHVHHLAALAWFDRAKNGTVATCPVTESGFVRVSSNPAAIKDAVTPHEAARVLDEWLARIRDEFWSKGPRLRDALLSVQPIGGYRQVTDAYLLSLASADGGTLVTLDARLRALLPEGADQSLLVIET